VRIFSSLLNIIYKCIFFHRFSAGENNNQVSISARIIDAFVDHRWLPPNIYTLGTCKRWWNPQRASTIPQPPAPESPVTPMIVAVTYHIIFFNTVAGVSHILVGCSADVWCSDMHRHRGQSFPLGAHFLWSNPEIYGLYRSYPTHLLGVSQFATQGRDL
jgi:hypothetical protein